MSATTSRGGSIATVVAACLAVLVLPASLTGTSVAVPSINLELSPSVVELQWVVNAYNMTFACFMLACGSLADRYGRKRMFLIGSVLFAVFSALSAAAPTILILDISRGVAGVGAAAMMTAGAALLASTFEGPALVRAFALFGSSAGAGLALGPSVSGLLIAGFGWRSVFVAHLVIALVVLVLTIAFVRTPTSTGVSRVDWAGLFLFMGALFCLIFAIMEGPQSGWGSPLVLALLAGLIVTTIGLVMVELKTRTPMFDFKLFRNGSYLAVCLLPVALAFGFVALIVFLPTYFTAAMEMTTGEAGVTMVLLTLPVMLSPLVVGRILKAGLSMRWLLAGSLLLVAVGVMWLTVLSPDTSVGAIAAPLVLIGIGMGLPTGVLDGAAVSTVEPERAGMASGMFNTMRLSGEAIAIPIIGLTLAVFTRASVSASGVADPAAVANQILSGNIDPSSENALVLANAFSDGLHASLWIIAAICVSAAGVTAALLRPRPPVGGDTVSETGEHEDAYGLGGA